MKLKFLTILVLVVSILSGCASGTKRPGSSQVTVTTEKVYVTPSNRISSVTLNTSSKVNEKAVDLSENGFSQDELAKRLKQTLTNQNLLIDSGGKPNLSLEIVLQNVRVRSTANAMLWGFMAGSDYITADVVLKDSTGKVQDQFQVETSYALGGLVGGVASVRIEWLYDNFVKEVVNELTGKKDQVN